MSFLVLVDMVLSSRGYSVEYSPAPQISSSTTKKWVNFNADSIKMKRSHCQRFKVFFDSVLTIPGYQPDIDRDVHFLFISQATAAKLLLVDPELLIHFA